MRTTLGTILAGAAPGGPFENLQVGLTLLSFVLAGNSLQSGRVPSGFSGRLQAALTRPTHGGLFNFLLWAHGAGAAEGLPVLGVILADEKARKGPFGQLVELRNEFEHPKERPPAQALKDAEALAERILPHLEDAGIQPEGDGCRWVETGAGIQLYPFVRFQGEAMVIPRAMGADGAPVFPGEERVDPAEWLTAWRTLRILDPSLDSPTPAEVMGKLRRLGVAAAAGDPPWWAKELRAPDPPARIVVPFDSALLPSIGHAWGPGAVALLLALEETTESPQALATVLGLAALPTAAEILAWGSRDAPLLLAHGTRDLTSRGFLRVLLWLADLRSAGRTSHLRILVQRDASTLQADQEALWAKLPEDLPGLLAKSKGGGDSGLPSFLWPAERPRRFLGLF